MSDLGPTRSHVNEGATLLHRLSDSPVMIVLVHADEKGIIKQDVAKLLAYCRYVKRLIICLEPWGSTKGITEVMSRTPESWSR